MKHEHEVAMLSMQVLASTYLHLYKHMHADTLTLSYV